MLARWLLYMLLTTTSDASYILSLFINHLQAMHDRCVRFGNAVDITIVLKLPVIFVAGNLPVS